MNHTSSLFPMTLPALCFYALFTLSISAQETYIEKSSLPAVVRKTAEELSRGATFKSYKKERGPGWIEYGVELTANGHTKYVTMDPQGNILVVEEEISLDSLPPVVRHGFQQAVQMTIDEQDKGTTVQVYKETIPNRKFEAYEIEMITNGHSKVAMIDSQGGVLEVDEDLSMESLPPVVLRGLQQAAGKGTIQLVKSITKHGTLVAYHARVNTAGNYFEIQVDPNGKILAQRE